MSGLAMLLQVGTVFLGAFLAFWLENLRERQKLRAWANDYLSRIREDLLTEKDMQFVKPLEATLEDYTRFIARDKDHAPNEDEWNSLMKLGVQIHTDHRALLESTAVSVLPAELVKALSELDERRRADEIITGFCSTALQQYTVPLALRQTPITAAEQRGLEYVQGLFRSRLTYIQERRQIEAQVLELLDKHALGKYTLAR